jgi:hypothetical protein
MTKDDVGRVWLLPHPGGERRPKRGNLLCHWPEGSTHARKFLQVDGVALSGSGESVRGKLGVWTEYEAPTRALRVKRIGRGPEFVHTPSSPVLHPEMNTDPWIFQPGFVWSICRQPSEWRSPARPGDIVLFGSSVTSAHGQKDWVLDTVMVVKKRLSGTTDPALKDAYRELVAPTLLAAQPFVGQRHKAETSFSFAPCQVAAAEKGAHFERPSINALLGELSLVNSGKRPSPGLNMALAACHPDAGMDEFWKRLVALVFRQGLLLGLRFDLPAIDVLRRQPLPELQVAAPPGRRRSRAA